MPHVLPTLPQAGPIPARGNRRTLVLLLGFCVLLGAEGAPRSADAAPPRRVAPAAKGLLATERLPGKGVWVDPRLTKALETAQRVRATVWFEDQLLGDGGAYLRRAKTFNKRLRSALRRAAIDTLKALSKKSHAAAEQGLAQLIESGGIRAVDRHWVINGFSCGVTPEGLDGLSALKGVRKIFAGRLGPKGPVPIESGPGKTTEGTDAAFKPDRYKHPWYTRQLLADRVWAELGVTGKGTLNVIHDHNFLFTDNLSPNVYRNPGEIPGNGKDDDGNGLIDDVHGYNFNHGTGRLTTITVGPTETKGAVMHGYMCAAVICGAGAPGKVYEFGIAPEARWAGVVSTRRLEAAIEWAIDQGADTYSMSFSIPGEGQFRSHRRKVMEHGSLCGVCFVSGAGNFALNTKVPVQMRQPEDIPNVVFSAAGVQRDLSRTRFSSKGPVAWNTEHYQDGTVPKPEVCAFNSNLPWLCVNGTVREGGLGGNSFAGPMFCGTIALMLSADPELLPWHLREIITETAMDVAAPGFDPETGHGLINCYRAVKEVLRRRARREGKNAEPYTGRTPGDVLDVKALAAQMEVIAVVVMRVAPKGQAKDLGVEAGDVLVSYGETEIHTRADLQTAKQAAKAAEATEVPLVLRRGETTLTLTFKPGPLGIFPGLRYKEPVFR